MPTLQTVTQLHASELTIDDACACGTPPCAMVGDCLEQALLSDARFGVFPVRTRRRTLVAV